MRWARDGFGLPQRPKGTVQQPLTPYLSKYRSRVPFFLFLLVPVIVFAAVHALLSLPTPGGRESKPPILEEQGVPPDLVLPTVLADRVKVPSLEPEPSPSPFHSPTPEGAASVSIADLEGELGKWWSEYLKTPKTGPWQKIPQDAKKHQVMLFGFAAKHVIQEHQEQVGIYLLAYGDDLVGYSKDPRVKQADRDRQEKLKNLLNSIWPGAMP